MQCSESRRTELLRCFVISMRDVCELSEQLMIGRYLESRLLPGPQQCVLRDSSRVALLHLIVNRTLLSVSRLHCADKLPFHLASTF